MEESAVGRLCGDVDNVRRFAMTAESGTATAHSVGTMQDATQNISLLFLLLILKVHSSRIWQIRKECALNHCCRVALTNPRQRLTFTRNYVLRWCLVQMCEQWHDILRWQVTVTKQKKMMQHEFGFAIFLCERKHKDRCVLLTLKVNESRLDLRRGERAKLGSFINQSPLQISHCPWCNRCNAPPFLLLHMQISLVRVVLFTAVALDWSLNKGRLSSLSWIHIALGEHLFLTGRSDKRPALSNTLTPFSGATGTFKRRTVHLSKQHHSVDSVNSLSAYPRRRLSISACARPLIVLHPDWSELFAPQVEWQVASHPGDTSKDPVSFLSVCHRETAANR